ncbi:MAG TPA: DMT family transporter [Oligoflexia bacterium]|nr:DMT family transporter [Oligoflexia bacterium]
MTLPLGPLAAFMASVTWAIGVSTYTRLSAKYPAYQVHLARIMIALPLFTIAVVINGGFSEFLKITDHNLVWGFVSALASFALGDVLFLWSTVALGAPAALAIASTYPFWSALAGVFLKGEALTGMKAFGLLLVVGGTVTVILSGYRRSNIDVKRELEKRITPAREKKLLEQYSVGLTFAFLTSLAWALNTYSGMQTAHGVSAPVANFIRMGMSLFLCPLVGSLLTRARPRALPFKEFKRYGWVFAFEAFGGSMCYIYGLMHAPLAVASALSSLAPVLAVPIGLLFGLEKFSFQKTLGIAMVVAGISLLV